MQGSRDNAEIMNEIDQNFIWQSRRAATIVALSWVGRVCGVGQSHVAEGGTGLSSL